MRLNACEAGLLSAALSERRAVALSTAAFSEQLFLVAGRHLLADRRLGTGFPGFDGGA
jgi:hypothetical protein